VKKFLAVAIVSILFVSTAFTAIIENIKPVNAKFPAIITKEEMGKAIQEGSEKQGWILEENGDSAYIATLNYEQYVVVVDIPYDNTGYSINYKSSENLNYSATSQMINMGYNRWVAIFDQSIRLAVRKYIVEAKKKK
jgi:hypothetical protein